MRYPLSRPCRLRQNETIRKLIRQTQISADDLVMPFFVCDGRNVKRPVNSMPGIFQFSIDNLMPEIEEIASRGVSSIMLFGVPEKKDSFGSQAYSDEGIIQRACASVKKNLPGIFIITDVCLCGYTTDGRCALMKKDGISINNDSTLNALSKIAVSYRAAGADMVAPSAMMDGQVMAIRAGLDKAGYEDTPIMSYSAKYSSDFYAPFRDAACSAPKSGDRKSYQMDPANSDEALREAQMDIQEGADIVMVKPALGYLDIVSRIKQRFGFPTAAYNVSGEFAMVKAAALTGWLDEKKTVLEIMTCIKRAGADIIITYHAKDVSLWLRGG